MLEQVSSTQSAEITQPAIPVMVEEAATDAQKANFLNRLVINIMNRKWRAKGITFDEQDYHQLHRSFWANKQPGFQPLVLSPECVAQLIQACRREDCTVNSLLYVTFLLAQYKVQNVHTDKVLIPVDLRNFLDLPETRVFGYYASAVVMDYHVDPGRAFWDIVRDFDRKVKQNVTPREAFSALRTGLFIPSLLDGVVFSSFGDFKDDVAGRLADRMFSRLSTPCMLSNLGQLQIPSRYGTYELVALYPPMLYSANTEKVVEVLTFEDTMYCSITYEEKNVSTQVVQSLLDEVKAILSQQVG